ncbi:hypothetical protein ACOBQX_24555 [Actinokineospora sp. G85]|uniref:hypothetical protein n=1 Tax=Actinokineospora sp. G85 TaxID=3406626 RepID=UPI003C78C647
MSFRWRYEDAAGSPVDGPDTTFADQAEAELWFSDEWPDLLDAGIEQVRLFEDDTEVYGPMSLRAN